MTEAPETLSCKACGEAKPVGEYYLQGRTGRPYTRCKTCHKKETGAYQRANRERATESQRRWRFEKQYGITPEEYDLLLIEQGGVCAICSGPPRGRGKHYAVDHCHATGRVRGLLCGPCNRGIGMLGDDSATIRNAIAYLKVLAA